MEDPPPILWVGDEDPRPDGLWVDAFPPSFFEEFHEPSSVLGQRYRLRWGWRTMEDESDEDVPNLMDIVLRVDPRWK